MNGRLVLEGSLRIHWGVQGVIHLKEDDDQRTVVTVRKRNSYRKNSDLESDEEVGTLSRDSSFNNISDLDSPLGVENSENVQSCCDSDILENTVKNDNEILLKSLTLPPKLDIKNIEWDELDELLVVERKVDESDKLYQTMPVPLPSQNSIDSTNSTVSSEEESKENWLVVIICFDFILLIINAFSNGNQVTILNGKSEIYPNDEAWLNNSNHLNRSMSGPDCLERIREPQSPDYDSSSVSTSNDEVVLRRAVKTGSTAIKRRSGNRRSRTKIKRRCSINGHFYDRETSFFTPPHGSQTSVWVTSLVNTQEVINLMLEKYKVDSDPRNFALFVVRDNGGKFRIVIFIPS